MRDKKLLSATTLALALTAVLGVGMLAGCSQNATEDTAATETQEKAADDTNEATDQKADDKAAGDEAAGEDAKADAEPAAKPDGGAVWLVAHRTQTFTSADEESSVDVTYENDDHGNGTKITQNMPGADPYVTNYEFDDDGYLLSMSIEGDEENAVTYTPEKDEQGRLVKLTGSDGTTQEYTYYDNGDIKTSSYSGSNYGEDPEGNWVQSGTFTNVTTYDEEGLPIESVYDGEVRQTTKYTYERDESGKIVKMKTTVEVASGDSEEPEVSEYESVVECDDNGNVIRIEEQGEGYSYVTMAEYVEVTDPSPWARANAHLKVL